MGEGITDFQRYMLARLQDDFVALKGEHLRRSDRFNAENLPCQNRFNAAALLRAD